MHYIQVVILQDLYLHFRYAEGHNILNSVWTSEEGKGINFLAEMLLMRGDQITPHTW